MCVFFVSPQVPTPQGHFVASACCDLDQAKPEELLPNGVSCDFLFAAGTALFLRIGSSQYPGPPSCHCQPSTANQAPYSLHCQVFSNLGVAKPSKQLMLHILNNVSYFALSCVESRIGERSSQCEELRSSLPLHAICRQYLNPEPQTPKP